MNQITVQRRITELKKIIQRRFPSAELRIGPRPYGDANDVFLYTYAADEMIDEIVETALPHVMDILLKTGVYVHVFTLEPGTMTWLWNGKKKIKSRRIANSVIARAKPRVVAERRASYKISNSHRARGISATKKSI